MARTAEENLPTALETAQPRRKLCDGEPHRDARKVADRPQPDRATSRAVALDVRIAVSGKLLDGGVQGVHDRSIAKRLPCRKRPARYCEFEAVRHWNLEGADWLCMRLAAGNWR